MYLFKNLFLLQEKKKRILQSLPDKGAFPFVGRNVSLLEFLLFPHKMAAAGVASNGK